MNAPLKPLADDAARRTALAVHDRSFLVQAGAGSGKTAVMAGRIALMLAAGIAPDKIAAVTFTELAASELLIRVREFVGELSAGRIPAELSVALPDGLTDHQRTNLTAASAAIDDITCSTIHGFCQRLIKPYPVEADIDPGASVMDSNQADLAFVEVVETWLRDALNGEADGLLAEMVLQDPDATVELIHTILAQLRRQRVLRVDAPAALTPLVAAFRQAVAGFSSFVRGTAVEEPETVALAARFSELADESGSAQMAGTPSALMQLLLARPHSDLYTVNGSFRKYQKKGKWGEAAKRAGLSKADGERLNATAETHYGACCEAWTGLQQAVAARLIADLVRLAQPVMDRFRAHKRSAALLDFDDLIFAARDLLGDHDAVRSALAQRFAHVLVDEFQDTDPLQTEIFWRLCGEPPANAAGADWKSFQIRPGALFLVGDPKQAIYRFRGADVAAYIWARTAFLAQDSESVLSISTNFRSREPILRYVNERFGTVLSIENGQPGFTALDPFHPERDDGLCVTALDVAVADGDGKASAEVQRDGEAEAVADMCARLIGSETILDRKTGTLRACRPADIALLAPTGSDLWRYEEALERRGIPVATQAGKGLFRRQEIQDLIALTRVLADRRDTLALGALLRGPLVGLTEEELLDIVWALPRAKDAPDALPRLDLGVAPETICHPHARDIIEKLQALRRKVNATTPHGLLSQAVDVLRVRPILLERHRGQAERALANVDLYLTFARNYAVRGLRAFAEAMTAAWCDKTRSVEGRPDTQEEAVVLYTMHAAKGLEWPIVVPINTMTQLMAPESAVADRASGRFYCPVFDVKPTGYDAARNAEKAELDRERMRLWYVAATRARDLLVIPRLDVAATKSTWIALLDLALAELPALDLSHPAAEVGTRHAVTTNHQTRENFAREAAQIAARQRRLAWLAPSRDEATSGSLKSFEEPEVLVAGENDAPVEKNSQVVQGGCERGLILHKLLEEVLTGETADQTPALIDRAAALIQALGRPVADDPALGLSPIEIGGCINRTLTLPEIAALRPTLQPEFPVYASVLAEGEESATVGIVDAIALGLDGSPQVVVDWKSDVDPAPETIEHYRAQVRSYLDMTGAARGLIVLVTSGELIPVSPSSGAPKPELCRGHSPSVGGHLAQGVHPFHDVSGSIGKAT
ncbi:AAA family ATPase [Sinorhizobium meliloti]|nr:AAA family ATPase [Sinorhizobium meliloti]MDW9509472.1 AAA family ATPase [Sinorhizobium meliloti]MDX0772246.1 AAA family ATPase [Sinorhizobium medicae]MDX0906719.1 AAA family ATPase [Sinorhizobium medicae]MDX1164199.1 AAA family ATPase [Sinorhizobium medicae]